MQDTRLENAYHHCEGIARNHYENFPVASWFLPKRIRQPIAVIYAFARTADDLADEGTATAEERLQQLADYGRSLDNEQPHDPIFIAVRHIITQYTLPPALFHDLLHAFTMDVTQKRYADFDELLNYCRYSANPIGRLLLHLNNCVSPQALQYSDAICTALQLINFYQDLVQDYEENNRIYVPQDEMQRFGVTEEHFRTRTSDKPMQQLMLFQVNRARDMLVSGRRLGTILPGRMGFELRMVIAGGLRICDKLINNKGKLFSRPRLSGPDLFNMFWQAIRQAF